MSAVEKEEEQRNTGGRPKGTGRPISRLRSTLNKLKGLEAKSLENIKMSVEGIEIDKSRLDTSKWVISSITQIHKIVSAEDAAVKAARQSAREEEEEDEEVEEQEDAVDKAPVLKFHREIIKD